LPGGRTNGIRTQIELRQALRERMTLEFLVTYATIRS